MLSVRVVGLEQAKARLAEAGRKVDPVLRGALNTTAGKARAERYVKPMAKLYKSSLLGARLGGADVRGKLTIKRAKTGRMNSRIIPSSSGVRLDDYRRWLFEWIDPTRARVFVVGLRGRKVAAGFVNPSTADQKPLSTRASASKSGKTPAYKRSLTAALGPSTAYWFKQLTSDGTIRWTNTFLQQEFAKRMRKELAR